MENTNFTEASEKVLLPEELKKKKRKKRIITLLIVFINVAVIGITAYLEFGKSDVQKIAVDELNLLWLIPGFFAALVSMVFSGLKFSVMMKATIGKFCFKTGFGAAVVGKYYDNITPLGSGGQGFQVYYLVKKNIPAGTATLLPVIAYIFNHLGFVTLIIWMFVFRNNVITSTVVGASAVFGAVIILTILVALFMFSLFPKTLTGILRFIISLGKKLKFVKNEEELNQKVLATLNEYSSGMKSLGKYWWSLIVVFILSLLYHISLMIIPFFVLKTFGLRDSWVDILATNVLIYAAIAVVPTPGNAGAAEGMFYALFKRLSSGHLFWAMLIWRFFSYYFYILSGGIHFIANGISSRIKKKGRAE